MCDYDITQMVHFAKFCLVHSVNSICKETVIKATTRLDHHCRFRCQLTIQLTIVYVEGSCSIDATLGYLRKISTEEKRSLELSFPSAIEALGVNIDYNYNGTTLFNVGGGRVK